MVEFALILFPLLLIVAGIIQFGIGLNYWLDMQRIANQGARWAAVNCGQSAITPPTFDPCDPSLEVTLRDQALTAGLQDGVCVEISFPSETTTPPPYSGDNIGDPVMVRLSTDFDLLPILGVGALRLRADATMRLEQSPERLRGDRTSMSVMSPTPRERGQVVIVFALMIPVFFALGSVVMSVGNWYVHKRHLQTQVDAAVLAAGTQFVGCFLDEPGSNDEVRDEALRYAGDTLRDPTSANLQIQEPGDVRVALNSSAILVVGERH